MHENEIVKQLFLPSVAPKLSGRAHDGLTVALEGSADGVNPRADLGECVVMRQLEPGTEEPDLLLQYVASAVVRCSDNGEA